MACQFQAESKKLSNVAGAPWGRGISDVSTCVGDDFSRFVTMDVDEMPCIDEDETVHEDTESLIQSHLHAVNAVAVALNPSLVQFEDRQGSEAESGNSIVWAPPCTHAPSGVLDVVCSAINPALLLANNHPDDEESLMLSYPKHIDASAEFINPSLMSCKEEGVQQLGEESVLQSHMALIDAVAGGLNPAVAVYDEAEQKDSGEEESLLQSYLKGLEAVARAVNPSLVAEETAELELELAKSVSPGTLCLSALKSSLSLLTGRGLFFEPVDEQVKDADGESLIRSHLKTVHAMTLRVDSALDYFREEHEN